MSVRKPKLKNIDPQIVDEFIMHHLPYELWMMNKSVIAALEGDSDRFIQNANVECFALHARNLIEFVKNGDNCGYNPSDFTIDKFKVDRKFIRESLIVMINTQISHLTTRRTKLGEDKFGPADWKETHDAISREMARWIKNLELGWQEKWNQRDQMDQNYGVEINKIYVGKNASTSSHPQALTTTHTRGEGDII